MMKYLRRRWVVFYRLRHDPHSWREHRRCWTYQGAAKVMGAAVVDRYIGPGYIYCLVDLRDSHAVLEAAQVGTHDALDRWYGGPLHQPMRIAPAPERPPKTHPDCVAALCGQVECSGKGGGWPCYINVASR